MVSLRYAIADYAMGRMRGATGWRLKFWHRAYWVARPNLWRA